jgi:glutamate-1-semialdehyde aminotransferase
VFCLSWTRSAELRDHRDLARCDPAGIRALQEELVRRGVRIAPRGNVFLSAAHDRADLQHVVDVIPAALAAAADAVPLV